MTALRDPVLGERARLALRVDAGGRKRQKLLVLLAAYADVGVTDPPLKALMRRMGMPVDWKSIRQTDVLLRCLEAQGLVRVDWARGRPQRNRYELLFTHNGDEAGEQGS